MMALAIPLTAVVGHVVVKPIVEAITKLSSAQAARSAPPEAAQGLLQLEERLSNLERTLGRIEEEQEFQRKLLGGRADDAKRAPLT
jgi:hypothetical protein